MVRQENNVFAIAEIGINHGGDPMVAAKMIRAAKAAGANQAKFQSYRAAELLGIDHPCYAEADKAQMSPLNLVSLSAICDSVGIEFGLSIFHPDQVDFCENGLHLKRYKVASRAALNIDLLREIGQTKKPVIMSCGMTGPGVALDDAMRALDGCPVTLLECICKYPAPIDAFDPMKMKALGYEYGVPYGFSSHCPLQGPTIAAVAHGASVIENHILPDDGSYKGCDAASSMPMQEYAAMLKYIREMEVV